MNLNLEFDSAADASTAMRKLLRNRPDVVISDIQMPGTDGIEFCRALRGTPGLKQTHFILMSSRWTDERRQAAQQLGVSSCLQKPVSADALAQLVTKLLEQSR
jgi:CheY-like chemotaxis protein